MEYIGLLLTVDWFLDRCRTTINVLGDVNVSCLLDAKMQVDGINRMTGPKASAALLLFVVFAANPTFAQDRSGDGTGRTESANATVELDDASTSIRVATFNTSLNREKAGQLQTDLSDRNNQQAKSIAEIIQIVRPQIILLNEFDYDPEWNVGRAFQTQLPGCFTEQSTSDQVRITSTPGR